MTAREAAEIRNRSARALLAAGGETLPEVVDLRPAVAQPIVVAAAPAPVVPSLTADDLTPDERSIYNHLVSRIHASAGLDVDLVEHYARVARESARARRVAGARA